MPRLASMLLAGALSVSIVLTLGRYVFPDEDDDDVEAEGRHGASERDDAGRDPVTRTRDVDADE